MSYSKYNNIKYSNNDDGTFWPGVVEVPDEDKLINEGAPNQNSGISEEAKRIITGVVLIAIIFIATLLGNNYLFILLFIVGIFATKEWHNIFNYGYIIPYPLLLYGGLAPSLVIYFYSPEKIYIPLLIFPVGLFLYIIYTNDVNMYDFIGTSYVFHTWFGVGLGCIVYVLKIMDAQFTLLTFACIAISDSTAYEVGRRFGTKKLAPSISPNKTVEGFVSALFIGSVLYSIVLNTTFEFPIYIDILIAIGFTIAGVLGDLFQSKIKRSIDIKDTSDILPGHGGVLDRIDSYLFCFPYVTILIMLNNIFI
tara:strand:- start:159 stop:1082 length:924 start_codon:yes stop_codon:yes gene_type:complete